jgi:hypothetical protein
MPNFVVSSQRQADEKVTQAGEPLSLAGEVPDLFACFALVERIAASSQLRRAARLRELLQFIGRRQLREQCGQLHEQEIGIEVFGRSPNYDTNVDNIVRANVSELRKRIDAFFETEGSAETFSMEIPRGGYSLVFRKRQLSTPSLPGSEPTSVSPVSLPAPAVASAPLTASATRPNRRFELAAIIMILLLGGVCTALWVQNRALRSTIKATDESFFPWRYEPTVGAFWSAFLDSNQDTDVIVPDAALGQEEYYTRTSVSLRDYVNRSYIGELQNQKLSPDVRTVLSSFNSLNFVTLSAIKMAHNILALDPLNKKMHLFFSREYIPSFVDRDNVILLGDPVSNPFIQLIENRLNFTMDRDGNHLGPVINHAPRKGEQSVYTASDSTGYCVVAYLPNPGHSGRFLLIQGSSPAATEAAEFFLLSETQLHDFKKNLQAETLPYFEVLLKTSQVTGTPLTAQVEAYRVHAEQ